MPNFYQVLGLPSTASRAEIRSAYWCQLSRIRTGELPGFLEDSIEEAFAILDYPDRRVEYDVQLAIDSERGRRLSAIADPFRWMPPSISRARIGRTLAGLALIAAAALVLMLSFVGGSRPGPMARHVVAGRTGGAGPSSAAPSQQDAVAQPAVAPQSADPAPFPVVAAVAPAPAVVAPTQLVAAAPSTVVAPVTVVSAPASMSPGPTEDALPYVPPVVSAPVQTVSAPVTLPAGAPTIMTLATVWSRAFVGARITTRVGGRYCRDSSGGQIFTPISAPVSATLSC